MAILEALDSVLSSAILRTLELEPDLPIRQASERVVESLVAERMILLDRASLEARVQGLAARFSCFGVLNPHLLAALGLRTHFFLVRARPGWLDHLVTESGEEREGISQYVVYGDWDSLLILRGSDEEAAALKSRIIASPYADPTHFATADTLLFYRYQPRSCGTLVAAADEAQLNAVVTSYSAVDHAALTALRDKGYLLGPGWTAKDSTASRIVAFVGISLHGRYTVQPADVLTALREHEILRTTLVHLFETERSHSFAYFAKLSCANMAELDRATNAIGYSRFGQVRFEGATLVVAKGFDQVPRLRHTTTALLSERPDLADIETIARETVARLGPQSVRMFNLLPSAAKLAVLRSLDDLDRETLNRAWDNERERGIRSAVNGFARACLAPDESSRLNGAVVDIASTVEGLLRNMVQIAGQAVYDRDKGRIQTELRLPTKKFQELSLGKSTQALRIARDHPDFTFLEPLLTDDWLERLDAFTDQRNHWAHNAVPEHLSKAQQVEEARRIIVEGIALIRWLSHTITPAIHTFTAERDAAPDIQLPDRRPEREFGIFISHSTHDGAVAEKVANALSALSYPVWYAGWAISPSDSIVQRIEEGLAMNDTLVVLLSPHSVKSKWVLKELNSALMAQLAGYDVLVIPVLIEKCTIPTVLKDILYVDLATDFEKGFIRLLEKLRERKERRGRTGEYRIDDLGQPPARDA